MDTNIRRLNQVDPPQPKAKRVDKQGNHRYRVFYKDGDASMLFTKGITKPAANVMITRLKEHMAKLGVELKGHFIITM